MVRFIYHVDYAPKVRSRLSYTVLEKKSKKVEAPKSLAGYDACLSVDTQTSRFESAGFIHSKCELMTDIYKYLPGRLDIEKLEFLDDVDIFNQLLQHYSITTSTNSDELIM